MKTTQEIIDEVAARFTKLSDRSTQDGISCVYESPDGKNCAVGIFMETPKKYWGTFGHLTDAKTGVSISRPDLTLKPEYRGHSIYFWNTLQTWHDTQINFTETGLSEVGQERLRKIRGEFAE